MLLRNCVLSTLSKRFMINSNLNLAVVSEARASARAGLPSLTVRLLTRYSFQKIRTIAFRLLQSSLATPARNLGVIAGQQNFGRPHAFELRRPCVVRIIQDAVRERFGSRRCLAAQRTG